MLSYAFMQNESENLEDALISIWITNNMLIIATITAAATIIVLIIIRSLYLFVINPITYSEYLYRCRFYLYRTWR